MTQALQFTAIPEGTEVCVDCFGTGEVCDQCFQNLCNCGIMGGYCEMTTCLTCEGFGYVKEDDEPT